jgi:hypothetical protein
VSAQDALDDMANWCQQNTVQSRMDAATRCIRAGYGDETGGLWEGLLFYVPERWTPCLGGVLRSCTLGHPEPLSETWMGVRLPISARYKAAFMRYVMASGGLQKAVPGSCAIQIAQTDGMRNGAGGELRFESRGWITYSKVVAGDWSLVEELAHV